MTDLWANLIIAFSIGLLVLTSILGGYLVGVGRWRLGGCLVAACVFLILKDNTPGGQFSDLPLLIAAVALYLALVGLTAGFIRLREWGRAAGLVTVTVLAATVPHLLGRLENARIEAMVLDAALVPAELHLSGASIVILDAPDIGRLQLAERFDLASVHVVSFRERPLAPLRSLSAIPLILSQTERPDFILTTSHYGSFSENYPEHARLSPELAEHVWEEAYLFDASAWPAPESLIARQVVAHRRVPLLGFPWTQSGQLALDAGQTFQPLFCAVERDLRRFCDP
ncbi:hypothetical protein [Gymnodinialimonas sp.]